MAHTLDQFDFEVKPRYPWHAWCNGSIWKLEVLKDFADTDRMLDSCKYQAAKRNMRLRHQKVSDGLVIQFLPQFVNQPQELAQQAAEKPQEEAFYGYTISHEEAIAGRISREQEQQEQKVAEEQQP